MCATYDKFCIPFNLHRIILIFYHNSHPFKISNYCNKLPFSGNVFILIDTLGAYCKKFNEKVRKGRLQRSRLLTLFRMALLGNAHGWDGGKSTHSLKYVTIIRQ